MTWKIKELRRAMLKAEGMKAGGMKAWRHGGMEAFCLNNRMKARRPVAYEGMRIASESAQLGA